jgi:MFS family permease
MGYMMVALSIGIIFGPGIGGYLKYVTGDDANAIKISVLAMLVAILYTAILPESRVTTSSSKDPTIPKSSPVVLEGVTPVKIASISIFGRIKQYMINVLDPLLLFLPGRIEPAPDVGILPSRYTLVLLLSAYALIQFSSNGKE